MSIDYKKLILGVLLLIRFSPIYAAHPLNLSQLKENAATDHIGFKEINRELDFNHTLHVRIQETYADYPVLGADAVLHIPHAANAMMPLHEVLAGAAKRANLIDGEFYQALRVDLGLPPALLSTAAYREKVWQHTVNLYQQQTGNDTAIQHTESKLVVYLDDNQKAHWAYQIKFAAHPRKPHRLPTKPVYLLDALSLKLYEQWDEIQTFKTEAALGGGLGGNEKMGQLIYDGTITHLPALQIKHDTDAARCYLENKEVSIEKCVEYDNDYLSCRRSMPLIVSCRLDPSHNNIYWNGQADAVNGGYSPSNDVLFNGSVIKNLYRDWYHHEVLADEKNKATTLNMVVHLPIDNAYWDNEVKRMYFGDGVDYFYPLTYLTIAAHEISHGFTMQHSGLIYLGQSGGMNESFSDMAAVAANFYASKTQDVSETRKWQIGWEIIKMPAALGCNDSKDCALRYVDEPSKDCHGKNPGDECSIDEVKQYYDGLNVHYSSGIYNRVFYLLASSPNFGIQNAFAVMAKANANYWTSRTNFAKGACGVLKASADYQYDINVVRHAFKAVGIETKACRS